MARSAELSELWKYKSNNSNNFYICNVCRLCANICDNVVPIFDKVNEKGSIYDKLKKCLPSISVSIALDVLNIVQGWSEIHFDEKIIS